MLNFGLSKLFQEHNLLSSLSSLKWIKPKYSQILLGKVWNLKNGWMWSSLKSILGSGFNRLNSASSVLTVNSYTTFKSIFSIVRLDLYPVLSVMSTLIFPMKNRNTLLSDWPGHFSRKAWTKWNRLLNLCGLSSLTSNFFLEVCYWGVISLDFQFLNQPSGHMV